MSNRFCKFLLVIAALLFLFSVSACQSEAKDSKPSDKPSKAGPLPVLVEVAQNEANQPGLAGKIEFEEVVHDFGQVLPNSYNDCKFTFKNTGEGVLHIDRLKGTCKCTVPDLDKKDYAPGESGQIGVRFHAPRYPGSTSQRVMVFSNDAENPKVQLQVKAYVQSDIKVEPEKMTLSLLKPDAGMSQITLTSEDGERFSVKKVVSAGEVVKVDFDPNNISAKHVFNPVVDMEKLEKYLHGYIDFTLNHPKTTNVRVEYSCLKKFETSPTVIILRNSVVGQTQERLVYLTSNYDLPIDVESISSDKDLARVIDKKTTKTRFEFKIAITPPEKQGNLRIFSDMLRIKLKSGDELTIPCRGFYVPEEKAEGPDEKPGIKPHKGHLHED